MSLLLLFCYLRCCSVVFQHSKYIPYLYNLVNPLSGLLNSTCSSRWCIQLCGGSILVMSPLSMCFRESSTPLEQIFKRLEQAAAGGEALIKLHLYCLDSPWPFCKMNFRCPSRQQFSRGSFSHYVFLFQENNCLFSVTLVAVKSTG